MSMRRWLIGQPIARAQAIVQRVSVFQGLAIFSSDALSSVAYATEEMLSVLIAAGVSALAFSVPIALAIGILIIIVGASYRQAIEAYPNGGGAYGVARENLGKWASLVAAGALMIDYILTVAVSTTAGIRAMTSAFPSLLPHTLFFCILVVILLAWLNIRGLRETANILTLPTYLFILFVILLVVVGFGEHAFFGLKPLQYVPTVNDKTVTQSLSVLLILRAFSSGCSAMTGIEAVANGVEAFREPSAKNARKALLYLVILLFVMFLGISGLAKILQVQPLVDQSVLSQIGHAIFADSWLYYGLQISTCLILLLAANTSFAGFPILVSMISRDGYLPKQLQNIGDRLAFSNGIILLAVLAIILMVVFNADTHQLIPLYSVGVFLAFTLCQGGLIRVWWRERSEGWRRKLTVNLIGCITTAVATLVIIDSKFSEGAWLVLVAMPLLLFLFQKIGTHYKRVSYLLTESLRNTALNWENVRSDVPVVVPVSKLHKGTVAALQFAHQLSSNVVAIAIETNGSEIRNLERDWALYQIPAKLMVLASPYQSTIQPLVRRILRMDHCITGEQLTTVVLPKAMPRKWWHYLLHNKKTFLLRWALTNLTQREFPGSTRVIVEVPYHLPD